MDPSKTPLMPNPSGAPPNFVNPPDLLGALTGVGITLIVVSLVLLVCRLSTNLRLFRKLELDDCKYYPSSRVSVTHFGHSNVDQRYYSLDLAIFAEAGGIVYWALMYYTSALGTSRHAWDVPISVFTVSSIRVQVVIQMIIAPTMWASKAAILALYIRLFGRIKLLRILCYISIAFMALFYSMNIVVAGVYCHPRSGERWDGAAFQRCTKSAWTAVVIGTFSCLADLFILLVPFPVLYRLQLSWAKKLALGIVFATGIILVALSAVSLYLRVRIFTGVDPTWNGTGLAIVTTCEVFGTIMVSCAPALSAFWFQILVQSTIWSRVQSSLSLVSSESQSISPESMESSSAHTPPKIQPDVREINSSKVYSDNE